MTQQLGNNNENIIAPGGLLSIFQSQSCFASYRGSVVLSFCFFRTSRGTPSNCPSAPSCLDVSLNPRERLSPNQEEPASAPRSLWQPVCSSRNSPVMDVALKPVQLILCCREHAVMGFYFVLCLLKKKKK